MAASIASCFESWKTSVFGISIDGWNEDGIKKEKFSKLQSAPIIGVVVNVMFG